MKTDEYIIGQRCYQWKFRMFRHPFSLRFIIFTPLSAVNVLVFFSGASCIVPFLFDKLGFLHETMCSGLRVDLHGVTSLLVTWMARQRWMCKSERAPRCKDSVSVWSIRRPDRRFHRFTTVVRFAVVMSLFIIN